MEIRRVERVVVQTENYNQWNFEIEVRFSHLDLGISDEELGELSEALWDQHYQELRDLSETEITNEVESFFLRVAEVSLVENVATRYLRKQASKQTSKPTRRR